ncbi:MAG TPA: helix-turn-helix transcriptional regulator [Polyangiaceae bacterium]|nr:helix-turn-helix transcriptional regulator [Polyangiaceae bacterium]
MESEQGPRAALRVWRKAEKLSQDAAAKLLDVTADMIGMIERGERFPGRRTANKLKALAGIPTEAWDRLEDDEKSPSESGAHLAVVDPAAEPERAGNA